MLRPMSMQASPAMMDPGNVGEGGRLRRASCTRLHGALAGPDHAEDGARDHVIDHRREELLPFEVLVVLLEVEDLKESFWGTSLKPFCSKRFTMSPIGPRPRRRRA